MRAPEPVQDLKPYKTIAFIVIGVLCDTEHDEMEMEITTKLIRLYPRWTRYEAKDPPVKDI